jgi:hypothetical protein
MALWGFAEAERLNAAAACGRWLSSVPLASVGDGDALSAS